MNITLKFWKCGSFHYWYKS